MLTQVALRNPSVQTPRAAEPLKIRPLAPQKFDDIIEMMGTTMVFARNTEIYGEDETAEFIYKIVSGTVRTYKVLSDGRRQIGSFYLPGDLFGLEARENHTFSAEAISNTKVLVVKRSTVTALASRNTDIAQQLWGLTGRELRRVQDHILLLIKSAQERVADFLLEMTDRCSSDNEVDLPMSRQDIADYLGLTIETVSRTLTILENAATIALPSARKIVLRNRVALRRLNS